MTATSPSIYYVAVAIVEHDVRLALDLLAALDAWASIPHAETLDEAGRGHRLGELVDAFRFILDTE